MIKIAIAAWVWLACCGGAAVAQAQVPLQRLVQHYLPHYVQYAGTAEADGGPALDATHFVSWLLVAGADDPVVINALSVRNARLEIASAFEFYLPTSPTPAAPKVWASYCVTSKLPANATTATWASGQPPPANCSPTLACATGKGRT